MVSSQGTSEDQELKLDEESLDDKFMHCIDVRGDVLYSSSTSTYDDTNARSKMTDIKYGKGQRSSNNVLSYFRASPSNRSGCYQFLPSSDSFCSYILPKKENIILAVVLSKWDDIMGPQTLHVWLQEDSQEMFDSASFRTGSPVKDPINESSSNVFSENETYKSRKMGSSDVFGESVLLTAVNYVTNHTVNCLTVSATSGPSRNSHEKGTSFFAVPDINLVFLSLLFQVNENGASVPYSMATIVSYEHYDYFLRLRALCLQRLKRIALRFQIVLVKDPTVDKCFWKSLNHWILEFCNMFVELRQSGLKVVPFQVTKDILKFSVLRRALSSHLQTFGCSVIIGTSVTEINLMIAFLGLFLDETEKYSACLVDSSRKSSFHMGLKLQGLVKDEFGGRELASTELISNPIPVTVIDLTLGNAPSAVKQTSNFCQHLSNQEVYKQEFRFLNQNTGCSGDHESVMHAVRENGKLVDDLLRHLALLPVRDWEKVIAMFLKRLNHLALTLLNVVSWVRKTGGLTKLPGEGKGGGMTLVKYLKQTLKIDDGDFLIILSRAEKLKPGIYMYVIKASNSWME